MRTVGPFWLLLVVAVVHAASHMDIGVDTWISLASGRYVLAHGAPLVDPFSFNSRPPTLATAEDGAIKRATIWLHPNGWIDQAWITHGFFALVARVAGLDALVVLKYANYMVIAALLLLTAHVRRANPALALVFTGVALAAGRTFFEVRPQDVTNLLAAVLMLLLAVVPRRSPRLAWLLVPLFALWGNMHGGFVWGLLSLTIYVATSRLVTGRERRWLHVPVANLRATAYAAVGAALAVVALSPYRIANLTHPILVSAGPHAREWRNVLEWLPITRGSAGEQGMLVGWVLLLLLAAAAFLRDPATPRTSRPDSRANEAPREDTREFDLGAGAIVALTIAMAVTSRRFLPMAYLVSAPLLAQWLTIVHERTAAGTTLLGRSLPRSVAISRHRLVKAAAWAVAIVVCVTYAVAYARAFFGPWPLDDRRVSFADRSLQTVGQPWDACRFVKLNNVSGRMWNYWEAGGFWEWCQDVDRTSGHTPVQVFMDGRAQVAYDIDARRLYDLFDAGGPIGLRLDAAQRAPSPQESEMITAWVSKVVPEEKIWLAHMMERQASSRLAVTLFALPQWQPVFQDQYHTLLADTSTTEGAALAAAVDSGEAKFPTELSRLLTRAYRALVSGGEGGAARTLALARQAFNLQPSPRPVSLAVGAAQDPTVAPEVAAFCRQIVEESIARRREILQGDGSYPRFAAAVTATRYLQQVAQTAGDEVGRKRATDQLRWLAYEANTLVDASEW